MEAEESVRQVYICGRIERADKYQILRFLSRRKTHATQQQRHLEMVRERGTAGDLVLLIMDVAVPCVGAHNDWGPMLWIEVQPTTISSAEGEMITVQCVPLHQEEAEDMIITRPAMEAQIAITGLVGVVQGHHMEEVGVTEAEAPEAETSKTKQICPFREGTLCRCLTYR